MVHVSRGWIETTNQSKPAVTSWETWLDGWRLGKELGLKFMLEGICWRGGWNFNRYFVPNLLSTMTESIFAELSSTSMNGKDVDWRNVEYEWILKRRDMEEIIDLMVADNRVPYRTWLLVLIM
jgi:hypothetical protein